MKRKNTIKNKRGKPNIRQTAGMMPTNMELVVARYAEDIKWIEKLPKAMFKSIKIYNKGKPLDYRIDGTEVIELDNIGREPHTYLTHVVNNFNNLADITLFLPGSVMNKKYKSIQAYKILEMLNTKEESIILSVTNDKDLIEKEKGLEVHSYVVTNNDNKRSNPDTGVDTAEVRPMGAWFEKYFPGEEIRCLSNNCIFAASKTDIHKRKREFYRILLDMVSSKHPEEGHYMERLWSTIFSIDKCELFDIKRNVQ
jgi:hypothetical protein